MELSIISLPYSLRKTGNADTRYHTIRLSFSSPPGISVRLKGQLGGIVVPSRSLSRTLDAPPGLRKRTSLSLSQAISFLSQQVILALGLSKLVNSSKESARRKDNNPYTCRIFIPSLHVRRRDVCRLHDGPLFVLFLVRIAGGYAMHLPLSISCLHTHTHTHTYTHIHTHTHTHIYTHTHTHTQLVFHKS